MKIGRIPYINCYPVYGAIDRGLIRLDAELIDGVPTDLNRRMAARELDISVVSAVEYARDADRYLLLPDLAISCDGPVRSVMLFSRRAAGELSGRDVIVSRSSMTSVALLELLFENVWRARPQFVRGDAEIPDVVVDDGSPADARLVIGDAALVLGSNHRERFPFVYDLGETWKEWTGQPFVFAVWVAQRTTDVRQALVAHAGLISSRDWGLRHLPDLAQQAHRATGVARDVCAAYLSGLDYGLSYPHLAGLTEFYRRLVERGRIPNGTLTFLPAA
ncbi:MAG: menaquinone biosynthetic enzyme MqnA/MqnD family protein [Gemmatimonadaceae bacterium]